jgi:glycosyltransferase involved in cell wall biosynthesis
LQKTSNLTQIPHITAKNLPLVSVIVTTRNEEKNIENCLQSIKNQTFTNIELIVVDNFSEDKTAELAKKYSTKVYSKGNERSAQRNYGAKVSLGEYLIYLDADMILSPSVVEECVAKCESDDVDALYVPERIIGDGFWIKVRDFERSFYTGTVIDAVRFVRKDLFLQVEGFDETLIGPEDWDFDRKIRKRGHTGIVSMPLYHNEGQFNVKRYLKKKGYYTNGVQKYVKKWGSNDSEVAKQIGIRYRIVGIFVEKGKWKNLIKHPLLTAAMYFLRLSVAAEYLKASEFHYTRILTKNEAK